jgi:hypothetical protein
MLFSVDKSIVASDEHLIEKTTSLLPVVTGLKWGGVISICSVDYFSVSTPIVSGQ